MPRDLITHGEKVFFPERGETKGDLAEHYLRVAGPLMREGQLTRWGTLEDVSGFATFLASDESEFINGAELRMDGGWSATARIPNLAEMVFAPMAAAAAAAQNAG